MIKGKKNAESKETEKKVAQDHQITIGRAKELKGDRIIFDMTVNDVTIYGCVYAVLKRKSDGEEFVKINFPSRKGSDDMYYNEAYVFLSENDIAAIEKGIEEKLG